MESENGLYAADLSKKQSHVPVLVERALTITPNTEKEMLEKKANLEIKTLYY